MKVSVIIPAYNEQASIAACLQSLQNQSFKDLEIIVVDDGSTDKTFDVLSKFKMQSSKFKILDQNHEGAGMARNLGVKNATGKILVFVDADMVFDKEFIKKLTTPIMDGKTIGTFSKEEFVLNKDNIWSNCWNINKNLPIDRMHPKNYPDTQPVFRAIIKKEFEKAGGFKPIGYIDDYTVSEKLGVLASASPGAIFYHQNPGSLSEIYKQARWIGKSEYKRRKIKNETAMKIISLIRYNPVFSLANGLIKAIQHSLPEYIIFKFIYDFAIEISLLKSFSGEQKYK